MKERNQPHKPRKPSPLKEDFAAGKAATVATVGTHAFYEARRRELHPERYQNTISVYGSDIPKRVKGRSKRGWTVALK